MAEVLSGSTDRAIRWTTTLSVIVLAVIAAIVSYKHMYLLVRRYGETSWTAALLPISVDGMIAASSMSLLLDSRYGRRSGFLPWALLIIGSAASLAANVAVAEPSAVGRLIAGWPSCALIGSYELLMGQIRHSAARETKPHNPNSYVSHTTFMHPLMNLIRNREWRRRRHMDLLRTQDTDPRRQRRFTQTASLTL
jgi:hypothetical protein